MQAYPNQIKGKKREEKKKYRYVIQWQLEETKFLISSITT